MNKKFQAAIFDMDGVLIDSMLYWIEQDEKFLRTHNVILTEEIIKRFSGRSEEENMNWLKRECRLKESLTELKTARDCFTEQIYTCRSQLMPGVLELMKKIKQGGFKKAVASGAPLNRIKIVVERFGWQDYFDALVSPDHVNFVGKPDPRIYLYTAECLQVAPEKCVVFEDAENGVVAAKKAGMTCIAIPDRRWSFGDFSQADLIVDSLVDERINKFLDI